MKYFVGNFGIFLMILITLSSCERKAGSRNTFQSIKNQANDRLRHTSLETNNRTSIKMTEQNGVYFIPCKINGSEMVFIFDTGASDITMSLTEANFLYKQGTLTDDDFIGNQQYQIANGEVEEGTVINLKTVELGNRKLYNVQASIVHNLKAPLLLGQSALNKFGKISIDYGMNEITFE